jgi:LysW-gamma-L-alpha-aminoadipyl-6-phosphate/LysW-L-glutamyl-5-phosphate reductase
VTLRVGVAGGSGYVGGELLRLLLCHPGVEVAAVTSTSRAGRRVDGVHPNLRGVTSLAFVPPDELGYYDALLLATPHRETMRLMPEFLRHADVVIDLSGDFRLHDPAVYQCYYGVPHEAPGLLGDFMPGLPELYRKTLYDADRISVPGCMATAGILAVHPLAAAGLLTGDVLVDARAGSSGSGASAGPGHLHAERSGTLRVFAPTSHRHEAEITQATGAVVRMTATGVEAVRGVQVLCRVRLVDKTDERTVRAVYREAYRDEPFVRLVAARKGLYRLPEPKILSGSNYCDIGFAVDEPSGHALLVAALDNLVKGGAGAAVQCLNIRFGFPERTGLDFTGLHPN